MSLATCRIENDNRHLCLDCATYTGKRRYGLPKKERVQECYSCQQMKVDRDAEEVAATLQREWEEQELARLETEYRERERDESFAFLGQ